MQTESQEGSWGVYKANDCHSIDQSSTLEFCLLLGSSILVKVRERLSIYHAASLQLLLDGNMVETR